MGLRVHCGKSVDRSSFFSNLRRLHIFCATVVDQFPVRALYVQVGERAVDKIVFSMAELTGNIWMMENISEYKGYDRP